MSLIDPIRLAQDGPTVVDGVADGYEAFALAAVAAGLGEQPLVFVVRDGQRLPAIAETLAFVAPDLPVLELPAWDCLPYDRVSPGSDAAARRLDAMAAMAALAEKPHRAVILVSANALLQRMPPADAIAAQSFVAKPGNQVDMNELAARLETSGFERVPTVRDVGEFAVRGGILDLYAPGDDPLRLDFFGDTLESLRAFDVASQRTTGQRPSLTLKPMSEVTLTPDTISRFRRAYIEAFGAPSRDDALYAAVSEGRRFAGMEHWLPLFYERLETAFDYLAGFRIVTDHAAREAAADRSKLVRDYFEARQNSASAKGQLAQATPYKPVPPGQLYLDDERFAALLDEHDAIRISPFNEHEGEARRVFAIGARAGVRWAKAAKEGEASNDRVNVFDQVVK